MIPFWSMEAARRIWRSRATGRAGVAMRLLLIIAGCVLPAIGFYAAIGWTLWEARKAQLADLAIQQAELLAGDIHGISGSARILLTVAADFNQGQSIDNACTERLVALDRKASGFLFLAFVDAGGQIRCASDSSLVGLTRDLISLADAGAATDFSAGLFTRSDRFPGGYLPFFLPIRADGSAPAGTLVAALDLNWLEQHLRQLKREGSPFLASSVLTITDVNGIVLARDVRHTDFV